MKEANFSVDKSNNQITVVKEIEASKDKVWEAWTTSSQLQKWWALEPYPAKTKNMDFRVGGGWLYAMLSPENEEYWSKVTFTEILPEERLKFEDAFTDADGYAIPVMPMMYWDVEFKENNERTLITCLLQFEKGEEIDKILEMGFKEGFEMTLDQLNKMLQ